MWKYCKPWMSSIALFCHLNNSRVMSSRDLSIKNTQCSLYANSIKLTSKNIEAGLIQITKKSKTICETRNWTILNTIIEMPTILDNKSKRDLYIDAQWIVKLKIQQQAQWYL
jgi:hypothetical protein